MKMLKEQIVDLLKEKNVTFDDRNVIIDNLKALDKKQDMKIVSE
ncbi:hypothetical protein [Dethiothermospora halolimnae]